ncbi:MAG: hypothetical protein PHS54_06105 [Clostridia bacterium]|nr:hypothetical protein [Clostridia bacterium]
MNKKDKKLFNEYKNYDEGELDFVKKQKLIKLKDNEKFVNDLNSESVPKLQKSEVTMSLVVSSILAGCAILNFTHGYNTTGIITTGFLGIQLSFLTKSVRKKINNLLKYLVKLDSKKCIESLGDIEKVEKLRKSDLEK